MKTVNKKRKDGLLVPIKQWETFAEVLASTGKTGPDAGAKVVDILVLYAQQKSAFPDAYDDVCTAVADEAGFPRAVTKQKTTINGKEVETSVPVDPHRTEQDYIDDFVKVTNEHGNAKLSLAKGTGESSPARTWLQSVLNRKVYELSLAASVRQKKEFIDHIYVEGAQNIVKNGNQAEWITKLDKAGIEYGDFQTENAEENQKVLSRALRDWNNKRVAGQFV